MTRDTDETRRLVEAIEAYVRRYLVFSSEHDALTVALWALHTHTIEHAGITPYLNVSSAEKMSGKSTLLNLLEAIVARPWSVISPSEAVLFRKITQTSPTLLLDEADTIFNRPAEFNEGLRALLNAGFERGRTVPRCVPPSFKIVEFEVFGAKALFGIGALPDTVSSRSIQIRLQRKLPSDAVEKCRRRDLPSVAEPLREWIEGWRAYDAAVLAGLRPDIPDAMSDREADCWEPLLAISELAGPVIRERAWAAALDRSSIVKRDESTGVQLLSSIRDAFGTNDRITADELVEFLNDQPDEGWCERNNGGGITRSELATRLRPFGIKNQNLYTRAGRPRGFYRHQFDDTFARYLSPASPNVAPDSPPADSFPEPDVSTSQPFGDTGREAGS